MDVVIESASSTVLHHYTVARMLSAQPTGREGERGERERERKREK